MFGLLVDTCHINNAKLPLSYSSLAEQSSLLAPTQLSDFGWETLCDLPCSTNGERSDMLTVVTVESLVVVPQLYLP